MVNWFKEFMKSMMVGLLVFILLCIVANLIGCASFPTPKHAQTLIPTTQSEAFFQAIQKSNWLVTVSIMGIAISVFAFLNGNKNAMAAAVACFVCLSMSLAVARYATVMAIGGTVISFGLSAYTIFIKNRALKEIVKGVQKAKEDAPLNNIKEHLSNQSESTKSIVKIIKDKI